MKNTIKLFGIIILVMVIGYSITGCSKAAPETDFSFKPSEDNKGMVITGYKGNNVNVVLPRKIQKLPIVEVGGFSGKNIISVVVPATVKIISSNAFINCKNLTSIVIPNNLEYIGNNAFQGSGLTSIIIPANVKRIGQEAFQNCSNLISVTFKGNDITIWQRAFQSCRNLEKLEFIDGSLKPLKFTGTLGARDLFGTTVFYTENYFFNPGMSRNDGYVFYFHSGADAFRYCDKLSEETMSKLKAMGFLSTEEMQELERRASRRELGM